MRRAICSGRPTDLLTSVMVPWLLVHAVDLHARAHLADRLPLFWNLVISNLPGPPIPLYLAGAKVLRIYPFGPAQQGSGLNLTVMSTAGRLCLGAMACRRMVPDVEKIGMGFVAEIALLKISLTRSTDDGIPMSRESRLGLDSWVPLGAGLGWLWLGARHGGAGFALALLPGILLVSSAGAGLVWREDDRVLRFVALGAAIGVAVAVPAAFLYSVAGAVGLLAVSVASFVAAGHASLRQDPPRRDVARGAALRRDVGTRRDR